MILSAQRKHELAELAKNRFNDSSWFHYHDWYYAIMDEVITEEELEWMREHLVVSVEVEIDAAP